MATGNVTTTTAAVFIAEQWRDEVIASREANLVAAKALKRIDAPTGVDIVHMPLVSSATARTKSASTDVTYETFTETEVQVALNTHAYSGRKIEDIVKVQSSYDLRTEYTKKDGVALAKKVDTDLLALGAGLQGGDGTTAYDKGVIGSDGSTLYTNATPNGAALTDAGLRRVIQTLDDADVPEEERVLVIPPSQKNALLGIDKFTLFQQIGRTTELQKGLFGEIYGIKVLVTTNLPQTTASKETALLTHKDALVLAMQQDVRFQNEYSIDSLAMKYIADMIYGVKELRNDHGVAIVVS